MRTPNGHQRTATIVRDRQRRVRDQKRTIANSHSAIVRHHTHLKAQNRLSFYTGLSIIKVWFWVPAEAALGGFVGNVLDYGAECPGFDPALLWTTYCNFFSVFFPPKILSFSAGPLTLPTRWGCWTSSQCLIIIMQTQLSVCELPLANQPVRRDLTTALHLHMYRLLLDHIGIKGHSVWNSMAIVLVRGNHSVIERGQRIAKTYEQSKG